MQNGLKLASTVCFANENTDFVFFPQSGCALTAILNHFLTSNVFLPVNYTNLTDFWEPIVTDYTGTYWYSVVIIKNREDNDKTNLKTKQS